MINFLRLENTEFLKKNGIKKRNIYRNKIKNKANTVIKRQQYGIEIVGHRTRQTDRQTAAVTQSVPVTKTVPVRH
jgi:hypothetical protein